ncbi:MAG TPA: HDOD domain-containing protein, partial [Solidesulfovibrio magneticus]|nr:HDOD domain-containing protein [Solidesulfovibrio magneticus]
MQWEYALLAAACLAAGAALLLPRLRRGDAAWPRTDVGPRTVVAPAFAAEACQADPLAPAGLSEATTEHMLERLAFGLERLFAEPAPLSADCGGMFARPRPSPPAVAAAAKRLGGLAAGSGLLARLGDPATPLGVVAALVSADPILAGQVLTIANSPLFGLRGQLADVEKAVAVIGLANLKALAFSELLEQGGSQAGLARAARQRLVAHMARTAVLARRIAPALPGLDPAMAYTAGLLHDVGKLALPAGAAERR